MKKNFLILIFLLFLPKIIKADFSPTLINQVMIGQKENAKNEFVELYNPNDISVDLKFYSLRKKTASGSESNLISNKNFQGTIPAKSYFLISTTDFGPQIKADINYSSTSSLSKNNSLLLYDQNNHLIDKLGFGAANDFYVQTIKNPENNEIIKRIKINTENPNNAEDFIIVRDKIEIRNSKNEIITIINNLPETSQNLKQNNESEKNKIFELNAFENIKKLKNNSLVRLEGIVVSLPGEIGAQYFYIVEEEKQDNYLNSIQIYNYYKKFPKIKIGDKIRVLGGVSLNNSSYKIKTKEVEDIKILSSDKILEDIGTTKIADLKNIPTNSLVKVSGTIVQNKTNAIYIDDGSGEILINIKKGTKIDSKAIKEKELYTISGILNVKKEAFEIIILSDKFIISSEKNIEDKMSGEIIKENPLTIESRKKEKQKTIIKYFIVIFVSSLFFVFYCKKIKFI